MIGGSGGAEPSSEAGMPCGVDRLGEGRKPSLTTAVGVAPGQPIGGGIAVPEMTPEGRAIIETASVQP
jgi:hypothetical protein